MTVVAAEEYILSGDVPVKYLNRLKWGSTVEQYKTENGPHIYDSCEFSIYVLNWVLAIWKHLYWKLIK